MSYKREHSPEGILALLKELSDSEFEGREK